MTVSREVSWYLNPVAHRLVTAAYVDGWGWGGEVGWDTNLGVCRWLVSGSVVCCRSNRNAKLFLR